MDEFTISPQAHIGFTHLQVSDLEQSLAFYRDGIGFMPVDRQRNTALLSADGKPPVHLILTAIERAIPKPQRTTGLYHVAIRLPSRLALSRVFRRLLKKSLPFHGAADHLVSEALYLADPDGNGLELYTDRPSETWPKQNGQIAMATDPLDLQALLDESAQVQDAGSTVDPATDIGHIHLQVSDLLNAEAFYNKLLGFDITQRSYPGALFLAAGGYHHHIGTNIWASRGGSPPPPEAVGLFSFQLAIPNENARQAVLLRIEQAGIPLEEWSLNGLIAGKLFRDPNGIRIFI
jgi:catechol 2,3-dioxygenase